MADGIKGAGDGVASAGCKRLKAIGEREKKFGQFLIKKSEEMPLREK